MMSILAEVIDPFLPPALQSVESTQLNGVNNNKVSRYQVFVHEPLLYEEAQVGGG